MSASDWKWIEDSRITFHQQQQNIEIRAKEASAKVMIEKWNWGCDSEYTCMNKNINATIKNNSTSTVSVVRVGWVFAKGSLDCSGSLSEKGSAVIHIKPNQKATVSFSTFDGPSSGKMSACFGVTGVQLE